MRALEALGTVLKASFAKLCPLLPSCLLSPVTCAGEGVKLFVTASFCACGTTRQSPEGGRDAYVLPPALGWDHVHRFFPSFPRRRLQQGSQCRQVKVSSIPNVENGCAVQLTSRKLTRPGR